MVDRLERASHKLFGTTGYSSGTETFCPALAGQTCVSQNGQHNIDAVYKQARGYSLFSPVTIVLDTLDIGECTSQVHLNGGADLLSRGNTA